MVVIHREHGMRFTIYLDDHAPAHVHVRGPGEARIEIGQDGREPRLTHARNMSDGDLKRAIKAVRANEAAFLAAWRRIHG